jgi:ABC-type amino acid transport system permease subunit
MDSTVVEVMELARQAGARTVRRISFFLAFAICYWFACVAPVGRHLLFLPPWMDRRHA